jgi:hypothetical protein
LQPRPEAKQNRLNPLAIEGTRSLSVQANAGPPQKPPDPGGKKRKAAPAGTEGGLNRKSIDSSFRKAKSTKSGARAQASEERFLTVSSFLFVGFDDLNPIN